MVTGIEQVLFQGLEAASQGHGQVKYLVCKQLHIQVKQVGKGRRLYFYPLLYLPCRYFQEEVAADLAGQQVQGLLLPGINKTNA